MRKLHHLALWSYGESESLLVLRALLCAGRLALWLHKGTDAVDFGQAESLCGHGV